MPEEAADEIADELPLTPVVFHTLLCLLDGKLHGYAISQVVEQETDGRVKMGPGTLYGCLHRLADRGHIEECQPPTDVGDTERRRYYRLSPSGRQLLEAEGKRLSGEVRLLRSKKLLQEDDG